MMGIRVRCAVGALAGACLLAGCTSLPVTSDVNPAMSVSMCQTFAWAGNFRSGDGGAPVIANPLIESRLRTAITANLAARGVLPAPPGVEPSCVVGYGLGNRTIVEGTYPYGWGWGWGWGWPGPYGGWGWDGPYVYNRGLIAVNMYEARTRQPLWHASVEQSLQGVTGEKAEAKINEAVAAMFAKYPAAPIAPPAH